MRRTVSLPIVQQVNKKTRVFNCLRYSPIVIGCCTVMAVVFLFPLPATSRCTGILQFGLPNLLLVCTVLQLVFSVGVLVKGRLIFSVLFFLLTLVLFFFFLLSALIVGPSLTDVKREIERGANIPSARLKCIGGSLYREAEVIFSCEGVVPAWGVSEDVTGESSVATAVRRISAVEGVALGAVQAIRRYPLETSTLLIVRNECGFLVFYLSQVVL